MVKKPYFDKSEAVVGMWRRDGVANGYLNLIHLANCVVVDELYGCSVDSDKTWRKTCEVVLNLRSGAG